MAGPIPILVYHRIDDAALSTSTPPHVFRRHLMWLRRNGWRSLSPEEFAFHASRQKPMPAKAFVLTFDDGYECIATAVAPILQELDFQAVCFAATGAIRDAGPGGEEDALNTGRFLSWQQARELQSRGLVDFQSHTHAHWHSSQYKYSELTRDLTFSRDLLSAKLGLPREHFRHLAWPWGDSTDASRALAERCGFKYQYTVARLAFQRASSLQLIPRTCYDASSYADFQMQFWLQCGPFSKPWHIVYPFARKFRRRVISVPPRRESALDSAPTVVQS